MTQDLQEDFHFIDDDEVPNEFIEGEVDNYSIQLSVSYVCEIDYQIIDKSETTELQDVPIQVAIEQEIEECIEEVVSDMTLSEMYSTDVKINTDMKLEVPTIKSCETVDLQYEQETEECIASETVELSDIPVRIAYEQEECIKGEISDMILTGKCTAEDKIHTDELKLETPKINAVEICEMPSETKSEMPILEEPREPKLELSITKETSIVQSKSKSIQDMTLISNVPTPFHAEQEISLSDRDIAQTMTEWEISVSTKTL